ncbi:MAG: peptidase M15 [Alphaproteobacteria bacterium]|nr:MAG: peptidase M15 [Alphaproteobacteria bacterium]
MLRIRTGARYGLRWGLFGFVAAVLTLSADPINAAPYADIVVDANSGAVLHATNPDARRHPASLTKIMTLYLLFEQLDAGKLKLDTPLKVSAEASGQSPTKLGLKPGSTLAIEDAIKGMVTRSANDAAVVVAEAIAGSEDDFARLMTRKAQALGMNNTVYKNASGLPDDNQITTARDQSTLGRAIQERFPRYYKYFSIRTFTFRGESISNHNHLLGKVEGVDGIKTGYINASGFNLVTSVHRGNRYLVAVVMGGSSGGSRDARMRELINDKIALASIKRTAPMVAEASGTPEVRPEPMVVTKAEAKPAPMAVAKTEPKAEPKSEAKSEPKPEPMVVTKAEPKVAAAKFEPKEAPKAEAKAEPRFAVASATSLPVRFNSAAPPAEPAALRSEPAVAGTLTQTYVAAGSTDPIRPVLVKTLTVRPGVRTASLAASPVASPAAEAQPVAAPAPMAAAKAEPAAPPPAPAAAEPPASPPAPVAAAKPEPAAVPPEVATKPEPAAAPAAAAIAAKEEPAAPPPMAAVAAAAAKPEPTAEPANAPRPGASSALPAPVAAAAPVVPTPKPAPAPPAAKVAAATSTAKPAAAAPTAKPQHRPGWIIQVGAFPAEQAAQQRLSTVQSKASKMLSGAEAFTETVDKGGTTYYRARFAGLDKDKAEAACKYLKKNDVECVTVKN